MNENKYNSDLLSWAVFINKLLVTLFIFKQY